MAPISGAMWGTRAPTAKNFVATAIPIWPFALSLAMIDQVMELAPRGVALHAAGVGRGPAACPDLGSGGQTAFRPVRADFDNVSALSQIVDRGAGHAVFEHQHAGPGGARPERRGEMFGMPGRRIDGFLQIQFGVNVPQEELRDPLILLISAWRAPRKIRLAVAQRHGR